MREISYSIIIPVYNVEDFLADSINSVLNQTHTNFELILIDDGSTDKSYELAQQYFKKDDRIKLFKQENRGPGYARNIGIEKATKDYIIFLDSDDWLLSTALEKISYYIGQEYEDVYLYDAKASSSHSQVEVQLDYTRSFHKNEFPMSGIMFLRKSLNRDNFYPSACLMAINREFLTSSGVEFLEGYIHEDNYFTPLLLANAKRVIYIPRKFYQRRYRPESIMTSERTERNYDDIISIAEKLNKKGNELELDVLNNLAKRLIMAFLYEIKTAPVDLEKRNEYDSRLNNLFECMSLEFSDRIKLNFPRMAHFIYNAKNIFKRI